MTEQEMLSLAICFQIDEDIFIEKRGNEKWCVKVFASVLDRDLNRHYEPMPSNRNDEFINNTRFSLDEAFDIAKKYCEFDKTKV